MVDNRFQRVDHGPLPPLVMQGIGARAAPAQVPDTELGHVMSVVRELAAAGELGLAQRIEDALPRLGAETFAIPGATDSPGEIGFDWRSYDPQSGAPSLGLDRRGFVADIFDDVADWFRDLAGESDSDAGPEYGTPPSETQPESETTPDQGPKPPGPPAMPPEMEQLGWTYKRLGTAPDGLPLWWAVPPRATPNWQYAPPPFPDTIPGDPDAGPSDAASRQLMDWGRRLNRGTGLRSQFHPIPQGWGPGANYGPLGDRDRGAARPLRVGGLADEPERQAAVVDVDAVTRQFRQVPGPGGDPARGRVALLARAIAILAVAANGHGR